MNVKEKIWQSVFIRDQGKCRYCGVDFMQDFAHYNFLSMDHLHHTALGGSDDPENLVLCCIGCNSRLSKSGHLKTFDERKKHLDVNPNVGAMNTFQKLRTIKESGWKNE